MLRKKSELRVFSEENVPLKELDLHYFRVDSIDFRNILKIKTLTRLNLTGALRVSEADFVSISIELPLLKILILDFEFRNQMCISINGLKSIIEFGKQLQHIYLFGVRNLRIHQESFLKLLETVKSGDKRMKLIIRLTGCKSTTNFDVPQSIQKANNACFKVFLHKNYGRFKCVCKFCV